MTAGKIPNLPSDNLNITVFTDFPNDIHISHVEIDSNNNITISDIYEQKNQFSFNIYPNNTNVLIVNSNFINSESIEINFSISLENINLLGDINFDGIINILDIVLLVNLIFENQYNSLVDLNNDDVLDVIDVVQLINLILS